MPFHVLPPVEAIVQLGQSLIHVEYRAAVECCGELPANNQFWLGLEQNQYSFCVSANMFLDTHLPSW